MALLSGLLSGLLIGTSYIPFNGWALLFCYSPLWLGASSLIDSSESTQKLYRQIFAMGWIAQFVLTLIGFNWIFYVSSEFGLLH
jgi:apolipoprotein N-acyltransferase